MTCREAWRFLREYFHDELTASEKEAVDAHVAECSNCDTYVTQYRETIRAAQLAGTDTNLPAIPDDLAQAVLAAIAKEPR